MNKKNTPLIKWILGILVILMAAAYWTTQQTQNNSQGILTAASGLKGKVLPRAPASVRHEGQAPASVRHKNPIMQSSIMQFLANMIGMRNQNEPALPTRGHVPEGNVSPSTLPSEIGLNAQASQGTEPLINQETGNLSEANAENNPENLVGNNEESNAEDNSGNLSETNAENNLENLSEMNSENNSETSAENSPSNNPEDNSESNSESPSSCAQGCYPGCDPTCDLECTPECLAEVGNPSNPFTPSTSSPSSNSPTSSNPSNPFNSPNPSNFPTINPIPSNAAVSQNVAQQNRQNNSLSTLVASRQTLATEIMQSAQTNKYQTVASGSIIPANTTPASEDTVAKIKSTALTFH